MAQASLARAKVSKDNEFYTYYADIETMMGEILMQKPDMFAGKRVLLPCDDPSKSAFTRYFAQNFERLGLAGLMSTSFAPEGNLFSEEQGPTSNTCGRYYRLDGDTDGNGKVNFNDIVDFGFLSGDGDFGSPEITDFRDASDIIVTNPPFSLIEEFIEWMMEGKKQFLILAPVVIPIRKSLFSYLQSRAIRVASTRTLHGFIGADGSPKSAPSIWLTNLPFKPEFRNSFLSMADNLAFSKNKQLKTHGYEKYDNFNAIEVPDFRLTPSDYTGIMGISVSAFVILDLDLFDLLGTTQSWDQSGIKTKTYPRHTQVTRGERQSVVTANRGACLVRSLQEVEDKTYYELEDGTVLTQVYARLLVRWRQPLPSPT